MNKYSNMLMVSFYNHRERYHYIKGALSRHREMSKKVESGEKKSVFGDRNKIQEART